MQRIQRGELFIKIAYLFSKRSTCCRLQVGCVIVDEGRIIATGYNGALKTDRVEGNSMCTCDKDKPCTKAIHAEANAISYAAKKGIKLEGSKIYTTHSPCVKCAELIIQSGIKYVYYDEQFRDKAGIELLNRNNIITIETDFS